MRFIADIFGYLDGLLEILALFWASNRLLGKKAWMWETVPFILLGCITVIFFPSDLFKFLFLFLLLTIYGSCFLRAGLKKSLLCTVITMSVLQLCYGFTASVEMMVAPFIYTYRGDFAVFANICMIGGSLVALTGMVCICQLFSLRIKWSESREIFWLFAPISLILLFGRYIGHEIYGNVVVLGPEFIPDGRHIRLMVIQMMGIFSLFCLVFLGRFLASATFFRQKCIMLAQKNYFQEQYLLKAQTRYRETSALRHDMKNHTAVVYGLLEKGDFSQAKSYIQQLDKAASRLSFPFSTGNPIANIILENKAAAAAEENIRFSSSLHFPEVWSFRDIDLGTLLINGLDNAIAACRRLPKEERFIRVYGYKQGDFFLIRIVNSFDGNPQFRPGVGLNNIHDTVERSGGMVETSVEGRTFSLNILLRISLQF